MSTDPDLSIIMETVDDYKNELPEGVYIKLCGSIKNIHNKLKRSRSRPRFKEIYVPVAVAAALEIFKKVFHLSSSSS
jgi:hypothetical protein